MKSTFAIVTVLIAAPALFAAATRTNIPETGMNLLIGIGLIGGVCISRMLRNRPQ